MSKPSVIQTDPRLDLVLERIVDVPVALVWTAWTSPEHVKKWFTPAPWATVECEIDLRPGGGAETPAADPLHFTAGITMEAAGPDGGSMKYVATVMHADESSRNKHESMGFHHGWGAALDQLVALAKAELSRS